MTHPPQPTPIPLDPAAAPRDAGAETRALVDLHTRLRDTIAGFDTILDKAEPEFRPIAADFRALHIRQAGAVASMLEQDGHDPSQDGSVFGAVNRAVVTLRSWFDDISVNIMEQVVSGEKHVLEGYDTALAEATDPERRRILTEDRTALVALLDRHASD
jgi:hypothetical protein